MSYFKAMLQLVEVIEQSPDSNGYVRERSVSVASIDVTGVSASSAMEQMREHVEALSDWHADVKGNDLPAEPAVPKDSEGE